MKPQLALYISAILALAIPALAQDTPPADTAAIATSQQALDAALSFVGLRSGKEIKAALSLENAVQKVTEPDSIIPYLSRVDSLRDIWEIRLPLSSEGIRGVCTSLVSCVVRIQVSTGAFLEARFPTKDTASSIEMQPAEYWEDALARAGYRFAGYPESPPPKTFMDALEAPMLSEPCLGTEIVAWCVLFEKPDGTSSPYWCIVGRNSPFVELHREKGAPSRAGLPINYISVIDATSGEPQVFMN